MSIYRNISNMNKTFYITTNICNHITTELIIHRCTIIDYFNKV